MSNLDGSYSSLAKDLLGEAKLVAAGRKVVTVEDLAIFLMLLRFFSLNMNADGSLPTARWEAMWKALHEAGNIDRGWCHHRYARMRNFLAENDLLDWEDEDFVAGVVDDDGRFVPGKAAKWRASVELMSRMEAMAGGERIYGQNADDVDDVEEDEERKNILYGCREREQGQVGETEEDESILYGCSIPRPSVIPLSSGQPEPLREVLDRLGIDLPLSRPRFAGYSRGQSSKPRFAGNAWGQFRMAA